MATDTPTTGNQDAEIARLIGTFGDKNGRGVHDARQQLIDIGDAAVPQLVHALSDQSTQVRWEAAKTLTDLRSPAAAPALAATLRDDDGGVRWLAADALAALGRDGLRPTLDTLVAHSQSPVVREGVHHVLATVAKDKQLAPVLNPIIAGLDGQAPQVACLEPAEAALRTLS